MIAVLDEIGIEVLVSITPSVRSEQKWKQAGNLLAVRDTDYGLRCGRVRITRQLKDDENPRGLNSDDRWIGCELDVVHNRYTDDWRATRPVCGFAKSVWSQCWAMDSPN